MKKNDKSQPYRPRLVQNGHGSGCTPSFEYIHSPSNGRRWNLADWDWNGCDFLCSPTEKSIASHINTIVQLRTKHMALPGGATSQRIDSFLAFLASHWWRRLAVPCLFFPAVHTIQWHINIGENQPNQSKSRGKFLTADPVMIWTMPLESVYGSSLDPFSTCTL